MQRVKRKRGELPPKNRPRKTFLEETRLQEEFFECYGFANPTVFGPSDPKDSTHSLCNHKEPSVRIPSSLLHDLKRPLTRSTRSSFRMQTERSMPGAHPSPPPSSAKYRVLKVTLLSAEGLKSSSLHSRTYAMLWIHRDQQVRSKLDRQGPGRGGAADRRWQEKFVFAVTDDFLCRKESAVHVDVYRRRFLLPDELVGTARCPLVDDDVGGEKGEGGPTAKDYPVDCGGSVRVKMAVWKTELRQVGRCGEANLAMHYDELMMEDETARKKDKNRILGCFAA